MPKSSDQTSKLTLLYHSHTPLSEIVRVIRVVMWRGILRAAEEQTGHNYETIAAWIRRMGDRAEAASEVLVHDLELSAVEIDEFWSSVGKKGGCTVPEVRVDPSADDQGTQWECLSQDRASRFVVAWESGPRVEPLANEVVTQTRERTKG